MDSCIRIAVARDCPRLFELINDAYHRESGDIPPAFKKTLRFLTPSELLSHHSYTSGCTLVYEDETGAIIGVLCYTVESHGGALRAHFGPFAVDEGHQGKGVGGALLNELKVRAKEKGCVSIDAEVVNHRLDLFPMCE